MADDDDNNTTTTTEATTTTTTKAGPPPNLSLPSRASFESLFRGGPTDVSPGPLTLVSSFFSEDPDPECRSFSQLLAGAMMSPVTSSSTSSSSSRPSPFFLVPPGLSPSGLLDSPAMFPTNLGPFGISHQQALAQVTAQAVQSHSHIHNQADFQSSLPAATAGSLSQQSGPVTNMALLQQMPSLATDTYSNTFESARGSQSDHISQPPALIVDKPADDGYNWRKYGQKQVKGSEYPRSYYKCTHPNCSVKKKVERSLEGQITEIIYKGQHNHQQPPPNKRGKEGGALPNGSNELNGKLEYPANSESISQRVQGNFSRSGDIVAVPSTSRRDRDSGHGTSEQLSGSSDGEEVGNAEPRIDEGHDNEPGPKRRIKDVGATESTSSHKTVTEPRIVVQTTSEVDLLDDGYRWRKYGQKVVKGNPHPRSYYKCTSAGCNVRKHVERASTDPKAVITTYEGKHNHDVPAARNSSHNTARASAAANSSQPRVHNTSNNQAFLRRPELRNNVQRPVAVLQLKEEHEMG